MLFHYRMCKSKNDHDTLSSTSDRPIIQHIIGKTMKSLAPQVTCIDETKKHNISSRFL